MLVLKLLSLHVTHICLYIYSPEQITDKDGDVTGFISFITLMFFEFNYQHSTCTCVYRSITYGTRSLGNLSKGKPGNGCNYNRLLNGTPFLSHNVGPIYICFTCQHCAQLTGKT